MKYNENSVKLNGKIYIMFRPLIRNDAWYLPMKKRKISKCCIDMSYFMGRIMYEISTQRKQQQQQQLSI